MPVLKQKSMSIQKRTSTTVSKDLMEDETQAAFTAGVCVLTQL